MPVVLRHRVCRTLALVVGFVFVVGLNFGCVTSPGKTAYTAHRNATIQPTTDSDASFDLAFGMYEPISDEASTVVAIGSGE